MFGVSGFIVFSKKILPKWRSFCDFGFKWKGFNDCTGYVTSKLENWIKDFVDFVDLHTILLNRMRVITAPFNNMRTLKSIAQPTNAFFATVNKIFGGSSQVPTMLSELCSTIWFDYCALGNSRKLGGAAEHLIHGSERRICRSSFEF